MRHTCRFDLNLILLNLVWLNAVFTLQPCLTPDKVKGYCIPILECSRITQELNKYQLNNLSSEFADYVRSLKCSVEQTEGIHICCDASINLTKTTFTDYMSSLSPKGVELLSCYFLAPISKLVIGHGVNARLREFPFMALLSYDTLGNPFQCGGSLITSKYVLTAAHCVKTHLELIGVRLGERDINTDPDCEEEGNHQDCALPVEDFGIAATIVHPDYNKYQMSNDVALIKLDASVQYKEHIHPICLPLTKSSFVIEAKQIFFIAGWGATENGTASQVLQKAFVSHQELEVCKNIFHLASINENTICAGGTDLVDSCKGDSGGPLFTVVPTQQYVQYGIVSLGGVKCGVQSVSYPGIYVNVVQYMPWITSQLD